MRLPPLARGWFLPAALALLAAACSDEAPPPLSTEPDADAQLRATGVPAWLQEADLGPAIAAQERHTPALMRLEGVVGTGVGIDEDGKPTVRVYTMTPGVGGIPGRLDDVPVRSVVTGMFVAGATTDRARPAPNGYSVGHPDITAGTLGAIVRNPNDATKACHVLSNNHVLANANEASLGDNTLQPGPSDGGSDPADAIAALYDFEPLLFDGSDNTIDAAISKVFDPADANVTGKTPSYGAPTNTVTTATVDLAVQKFGRTTGQTEGTVSEVNVTVDVCYKPRGPFFCASDGIAHFTGQISISPGEFSGGGDSGSLIVDNAANPVGLLFAGSSTRTLANPIAPVFSRFGVVIESEPANNCGDGGGTVDDPPSASGMHIGNLDAAGINDGRTWDAVVTVLVHDASHGAVSGATVSGTWSGLGEGSAGSSACTTGVGGSCTVEATGMRKNNGTVSFSVTGVNHSLTYSASDNHDPDGDSDGTTITVSKS